MTAKEHNAFPLGRFPAPAPRADPREAYDAGYDAGRVKQKEKRPNPGRWFFGQDGALRFSDSPATSLAHSFPLPPQERNKLDAVKIKL